MLSDNLTKKIAFNSQCPGNSLSFDGDPKAYVIETWSISEEFLAAEEVQQSCGLLTALVGTLAMLSSASSEREVGVRLP